MTSRATGDDLIGDEQDAQPNGVTVPSRRSAQQPTAAKSAPAKAAPPDGAVSGATRGAGLPANGAPTARNGIEGTKDASANGSPAATAQNTGLSVADATIADGMPALPADTIGASRSSRPNGPDPDRETSASKVAEQPPADDSPRSASARHHPPRPARQSPPLIPRNPPRSRGVLAPPLRVPRLRA